jgi:mannose-6-phosphate isomerase-like protein (cupin superfamily)
MPAFTKVVLFTDGAGRARWREELISLPEGTPQTLLSSVMPSSGYQLRHSPVGFRSEWHCTPRPQWVFILEGEMQIGLQDGSSRVFKPGQHFYAADTLPANATFDPKLHGHWSAQRGPRPLVTLFLKT